MVGRQLLFRPLQAAAHRKLALGRVIIQHPAAGLEVVDLAGIQQLHSAAGQLQRDLPALFPLDPLDGAGELGAEGVIIHRLEHIVQRVHFIPPDGVLRHIGHKHQHHVRIHRPDLFRCTKTAQLRHLHIHKEDVEPRRVAFGDLCAIGKGQDLRRDPLLCGILADIAAQTLPGLRLIFHHCDLEHPVHSSFIPLVYQFYLSILFCKIQHPVRIAGRIRFPLLY